ncbi:hypothetical protein D3C71_360750 [compost metagenome]
MKDAYSNLLGEYVQAQEIDNDDIAGFQIVCPCCREEIFKVAREAAPKTIHFFSHYRASAAFDIAECERRVGSISESDKASASARSRNHTLDMFRSVVRDACDVMPIGGEMIRQEHLDKRYPMIFELTPVVREMILEWGPDGTLVDLVQKTDKAIEEAGYSNLTAYGLTFRNRIAADLLRTIFAGNHTKTIHHMIGRGHCNAFRVKPITRRGWVDLDFRSRSRKLVDHEGLKAEHGNPSQNPYRMTAYVVIDAMLRELHRLPYLKMIANAKQKLRPMHNVTIDDYLPDLEDLQPDVNYVPLQGVDVMTKPFMGDLPSSWSKPT